jgi:4-hydroxy-tetrahydrodipicolinate synthase
MAKFEIRRPGILVPPLTPFTPKLKVDNSALKKGVDAVIARSKPALIIAAGVEAQEYQFLPFKERLDLVRATIDPTDGRAPVAVGISHPSFKVAIELAQFAEKARRQCGAALGSAKADRWLADDIRTREIF